VQLPEDLFRAEMALDRTVFHAAGRANVITCMLGDLRFALRGFRRSPAFVLAAVASLALGIGANTAIFSLVNAVLLRALPVRDPDRLVMFGLDPPSRFGGSIITATAFRAIQEKNTVFDGFFAAEGTALTFADGDSVEDVPANIVSGNYFETLGANALIGRVLTLDDDRPGAQPACVIGYGFWIRRFGGDPAIIGRKILLHHQPFTIVGVTRKPFVGVQLYNSPDVTVTLTQIPQTFVRAFGRLKRSVSALQAQAALDVLYHQVETGTYRYSDHVRISDIKVVMEPAGRGTLALRDRYQKPLLMLMAVVGLVLLIACANVTNLLLERCAGRQREIAVRLALGAGRARLIRQFLAEALLLSVSGAALGILLAMWTDRALKALAPWQTGSPIPPEVDVNPDWRVLVFTLLVALFVTGASGILPGMRWSRLNIDPALKGNRDLRGHSKFSLANALVVAQMALSLVLLIGAGLFLKSLRNLRSVDPGFDPSRLILATVEPARRGYSPTASRQYAEDLMQRARRLPGVIAVSEGLISPLSGDFAMARVQVPGYIPTDGEAPTISINFVSPNYFTALGTPLVAGRFFTDQDGAAHKVAIVNESAARHYWPHENPVGKRITTGLRDRLDCEVVGVVKDVRTESLRADPQPIVYVPAALNTMGHVTLHVRVAGNPAPVIAALRGEIHSLDPRLQPRDISTMAAQIDRTIALDRLLALLTALFGFLGAAIAGVGMYGVMAFAVTARMHEIGIRVALGASRVQILGPVLRESAWLALVGIAIGVPAALWASRAIGSQLYGLRASDPEIYIALALLLAGLSMLAAWIPATRAANMDPMVALRHE
jgi:putative ABC transport system permease protein